MNTLRDSLGTRMKEQYENRSRYMLPRRTYTIIRLDGKAFHTYTRSMPKPFYPRLHEAMVAATVALCDQAQGVRLGYVQSDESSILLRDWDRIETAAWFDGNVQKLASVSASIFTAAFNEHARHWTCSGLAYFDARCFVIPDPIEVENYFVWRQKDAHRNGISGIAQSLFSQSDLNLKNQSQQVEMIYSAGKSFAEYPEWAIDGTLVEPSVLRGKDVSNWSFGVAPVFTVDSARPLLRKIVSGVEVEPD